MSVTFEQLIKSFLSGMQDTDQDAVSATRTLRISGEQLVHYQTPIAERWGDKVIVNISRYSLATGKLQKQLRELIPENQYITVKGVREGYSGSLSDFLSKFS